MAHFLTLSHATLISFPPISMVSILLHKVQGQLPTTEPA